MMNHLWQSTAFAAGIALLAWSLRKHRAGVRYALWFSASLKFVIPFALFMNLGRQAEPSLAPLTPVIATAASQVTAPFPETISFRAVPAPVNWTPWIAAAWACGALTILSMRARNWLRIRRMLRSGTRHPMAFPIEVRTSPGAVEPGVAGIWRCTLLLPEGIDRYLSPAQLNAVLDHELCHAQRRDNLLAAVHMIVETIFWFHPLVWWIGARLMETRELACDEAVVADGGDPRDYAEAILNVCKRYVESPLACVSGVSGADLKKRIEAILSRRALLPLGWSKRALLAAAALIAVLIPFLAGVTSAQSSKSFEVASIHLLDPSSPWIAGGIPALPPRLKGGRLDYTDTVHGMIVRAFQLPGCRGNCDFVLGGPPWIRTGRYRIEAKLPEGSPAYDSTLFLMGDEEGVNQMLRSLLVERFGLKVRREPKEMAVFTIGIAPGGHKLTATAGRTKQDSDGKAHLERNMGLLPIAGPNGTQTIRMSVVNFNMHDFADSLSGLLDRPVLDRTALSGRFDFKMEYDAAPSRENAGGYDALMDSLGGPALFTAMRDQLGLRMQATKAQIDVVAIDGIERPTEN